MRIDIHVKNGNKFVLTEEGKKISRIAAKYEEGKVHMYDNCVPESWVKNGWVKEVSKVGNRPIDT